MVPATNLSRALPGAAHGAPSTRRVRRRRRPFAALRRALLVRRRALAALLAVVAVLASVRAATAPTSPTAEVVVAEADLTGGRPLTARDLAVAALPVDTVPDGAIRDPGELAGRVLAAPLRRGEPVTDVRLVAPGLLDGYPGTVAAPVRLADPSVAGLLSVGDHVHLVATSPESGTAEVVAEDVPVVALPAEGTGTTRTAGGGAAGLAGGAVASDGGGLLLVAVDRQDALALAEASATAVISVIWGG